MGINAAWITERGEAKQEVFDPRQCITRLATDRWHRLGSTKCLQFIEPWGDAVFNQSQIPVLLQELRAELPEIREPELKAHLEKVIRLVERAVEQTHTYIKFIGD
jgi:hypothetical protein